jgi:hypothetical protein
MHRRGEAGATAYGRTIAADTRLQALISDMPNVRAGR